MKNVIEEYLKLRKEYLLHTFAMLVHNLRIDTGYGKLKLSSNELMEVVAYYVGDNKLPDLYLEERDDTKKLTKNIHYFKYSNEGEKIIRVNVTGNKEDVMIISKEQFEEDIKEGILSHSDICFNNSRGNFKDVCYLETSENDGIIYKEIVTGKNVSTEKLIEDINVFFEKMPCIKLIDGDNNRGNNRDER